MKSVGTLMMIVVALLVGCGGGHPAAPEVSLQDQMAAQDLFSTRCATCHGPGGRGDGPGSHGLNPQPRNFTDASWQASVTNDHIAQIIQYGGTAVGLPAAMPPNPDLQARPGVVNGLVAKVRSLSN